jgi:hypothetical protein
MPLIPHRTWLSTAMLACFRAGPLLVRLQTKQSLPAARFPIRPASLKPLFGTASHAFQSNQPLSASQLTDFCALSGDQNPIE